MFYTVMEYILLILPMIATIILFFLYDEPLIFLGMIPTTFLALDFGKNRKSDEERLKEFEVSGYKEEKVLPEEFDLNYFTNLHERMQYDSNKQDIQYPRKQKR